MEKPGYKVQIGRTIIDSSNYPVSSPVVSIKVEVGISSGADSFEIILNKTNAPKVTRGDKVNIELGYNGKFSKVIEGTVDRIKPDISLLSITGFNNIFKLLTLRLNQTYEQQSAGGIVSDLAKQAGVSLGRVEDGIVFPIYVIDSNRNAYEHIKNLAEKCGFDIYLDAKNRLFFQEFIKTSVDHTFSYGRDILELEVSQEEAFYDQVEVWGESPVSKEGKESYAWLIKDFADLKGKAGSGARVLTIQDASLKTSATTAAVANNILKSIKKRCISGVIKIPGRVDVSLGNTLEIRGVPDDNLNGIFQIRHITHFLDKQSGFLTTICFNGLGG